LLPLIAAGKITPILHQTLPLAQAADAHRILEANTNIGKVLLQVAP
ncbi:TPA: zinc-binding dehydrogenase, partial [Klebsiella pneumoniae]|nr:zinc-binding dehydrogenase [Klebsiella pneumoniae]